MDEEISVEDGMIFIKRTFGPDEVLRALYDPRKMRLLLCMRTGRSLTDRELSRETYAAASTCRYHLAVLERMGLVEKRGEKGRRRGRIVRYSIGENARKIPVIKAAIDKAWGIVDDW